MWGLIPEDAERIEQLEIELFPDNCFNAVTLKREILCGSGLSIYDADEETLLAYAMTRKSHPSSRMCDLIRIGVRPGHQGRGLGSRILEVILHRAYQDSEDVLLCVRKDNSAALRWYKRYQFRIVGELDHSWVMIRSHIGVERNDVPQVHL